MRNACKCPKGTRLAGAGATRIPRPQGRDNPSGKVKT